MDYLAKLNQVSVEHQIQELTHQGAMPPVEAEDIQKYRKFREERINLKREFTLAAPFQRAATIALAGMYDLDHYPPAASFRQGAKQSFEVWFHSSMKNKQHNTSGSRLFHGPWAKITAIPLYDLPLHLSGIFFINGHEQATQSCLIRRLDPATGGQYLFDPGFLGTRAVCRPDQSAVVLCSQWQLTLKVQSALYKQEAQYFPLLGWFPADPRTNTPYSYNWSGLQNISKIFWSPSSDIGSLREACIQNGMISFAHFTPAGVFDPPNKIYGGLFRSIIKNADPWHKALTWYLERDPSRVHENLKPLNLPQKTIEQYLEYAPAAIRRDLTAAAAATDRPKYVDDNQIISNEEGWWKIGNRSSRSLLANTRCHIEKVVHIAEDPPIYQGKVIIDKKEYPFSIKENLFEKYPIQLVKKVCVEHGCPHFLRINVKNDQYLRLIKETSTPETIYCREGYGWSKKEESLLLPNTSISAATVIDTALSLQTGPFHKMTIQQARPIGKTHRTALANFQEETPVIFSIFSAIVPALFSPAYRMPSLQTVIAGNEFLLVKQIGDIIGLPQLSLKDKDEIDQYTLSHQCPFLVRFQPGHKKKKITHEWADIVGLDTPAIIWTSITEAVARMSYGKANLLLLPGTRFYRWFDGKLPTIFQDCFMSCLRHISKYVLDPTVHSCDWNNDLIEETQRFFEKEIGVAPTRNSLFGGYDAQPDYFYDYVNLLHRAELLILRDNKLSIADLAENYRRHIGIFDFQKLYEELQASRAVKTYNAASQTLELNEEYLRKSYQRLEKFYGVLLRN